MRIRGTEYRRWRAMGAVGATHNEILPGGSNLNIQARMHPDAVCVVFVSMYDRGGKALFEEIFATLHGSIEEGLMWGTIRGIDQFQLNFLRSIKLLATPPHVS